MWDNDGMGHAGTSAHGHMRTGAHGDAGMELWEMRAKGGVRASGLRSALPLVDRGLQAPIIAGVIPADLPGGLVGGLVE